MCQQVHPPAELAPRDAPRRHVDHRGALERLFHPRHARVEVGVEVAEQLARADAVGVDLVYDESEDLFQPHLPLLAQRLPRVGGVVKARAKGLGEALVVELCLEHHVLLVQEPAPLPVRQRVVALSLQDLAQRLVVDAPLAVLSLRALLTRGFGVW
eukprot:CAMPEP_0173469486 /NCGR_PEP_ID=MMETSP1357-20121228/77387_1 /TAXON_ID=77926 /ORGANISM="Hemiselmis rufescens, Strain PCC563" /LENGTH=155 /DNA_ID=CAMNT_0014437731 /DNA_START=349 /DNA_END=813 /DNA_ORIENTATION=-